MRKTYIKEIDLLAEAFLEKSETAENIAQKVSGIISNSRTQIGVFEYVYGERKFSSAATSIRSCAGRTNA
ncbi:MAG: hypothetical protein ACLRTQ_01585 [Candidatus Borkfalkia sp.]